MAKDDWEIFVATAPGLEAITAEEIRAAGLPVEHREAGGLGLRGGTETLWTLNLRLRTASRVLVRLAGFRATGFAELERKARDLPWGRIFAGAPAGEMVRFEVTSRKSRLYHTGAVEERLRRSLDAWAGGRPAHPGVAPQRIVVRLLRDEVTVSADSSGDHLHRRGYREAVAKAPLRETLAAALVLAAEGSGEEPFVDPFCGSGTLVVEAALLRAGVPPGIGRSFSFSAWPGIDATPGDRIRDEGRERLARGWDGPPLTGSDRDAGAVRAAEENARRAGVAGWTSFRRAALSAAPFPTPPGILVTNPPYGRRVGRPDRLRNLYARLGDLLRERWSGGRAVLLSSEARLTGQTGLEARILFRTKNGGIPVEAVELTGL